MASGKKKAKRVATLFGKQKVTTTPEIAAKIKSGEIDPATHSINKDGKFAPKRKAVVNGMGIVPTTKSAAGSMDAKAKSAGGDMGAGSKSAAGYTAGAAKSAGGDMGAGAKSVTKTNQVPKTDGSYMRINPSKEMIPKYKVPADVQKAIDEMPSYLDKNGQPVSPAQHQQIQEQKAIKLAPVKEEINALNTQLMDLSGVLDDDDSEENMGAVRKKLDAFKAVFSTTN